MRAAGVRAVAAGAFASYRWAWLGGAGSVLALLGFLAVWTLNRMSGELARDFGSRAVWFLWAGGDPPVVAREPGGDPLPGSWERTQLGLGGLKGLSGRPLPRTSEVPQDAPDGYAGVWRGGRTGETREVDGVLWREYARWGGLTDLAELGCDPAFVGRWAAAGLGFSADEVTFSGDGSVRADGVPRRVGRWAGAGRLLIVLPEDRASRYVHRLVLDPSDPSGDTFTEDAGCEIWGIHRVR